MSGPKIRLRAAIDAFRMDGDITSWPANITIAMGELVMFRDSCRDSVYEVGKYAGVNPSAYFLVYTTAAPTAHPSGGTIVGMWRILAFSKDDENFIKTVKSGAFVKCKLDHPAPGFSRAAFRTCAIADSLASYATAEVPYDSVLTLYDKIVAGEDVPGAAGDATSASLVAKLKRLVTFDDPSTDPVWVTCGLGCCIAVDPPEGGGGPARTSGLPPGAAALVNESLATLLSPRRGTPW